MAKNKNKQEQVADPVVVDAEQEAIEAQSVEDAGTPAEPAPETIDTTAKDEPEQEVAITTKYKSTYKGTFVAWNCHFAHGQEIELSEEALAKPQVQHAIKTGILVKV